jgi:hypothetical protein
MRTTEGIAHASAQRVSNVVVRETILVAGRWPGESLRKTGDCWAALLRN